MGLYANQLSPKMAWMVSNSLTPLSGHSRWAVAWVTWFSSRWPLHQLVQAYSHDGIRAEREVGGGGEREREVGRAWGTGRERKMEREKKLQGFFEF